jgi:hypothetical protein
MSEAPRPRHTARRSRIAAVGVGVAAMAGLVGNMEVAGSHAHTAATASPTPLPPLPGAKAETAYRHKVALERLSAVNMPIVLTPHAVVHTVVTPAAPSYAGSSGGYSGGTAYAAAPARAAAPVASTGGSHP